MKKKQLLSVASLALFVLGVALWLFVGGATFHASEELSYGANGLNMIFGFEYETIVPGIPGFVESSVIVTAVTGFRFLALMVLILAVLAIAVEVFCMIKKVDSGILTAVIYVLIAVLMLVVGLTMANGYTAEMAEAIANIEELNNSIIGGLLKADFVPYWSIGIGSFLGMGLSVVAAGVSAYSVISKKNK